MAIMMMTVMIKDGDGEGCEEGVGYESYCQISPSVLADRGRKGGE